MKNPHVNHHEVHSLSTSSSPSKSTKHKRHQMDSSSPPPPRSIPNGIDSDSKVQRSTPIPLSASSPPPTSPPTISTSPAPNTFTDSLHTHGLDLPWVTRDINHSSSSTALHHPNSPGLTHRVSELNLSAHPSRHVHARKNQSRTACFVHSLLSQNGSVRARSPSRTGSSEDLTRGSMLEVINKGSERRDRWNRGMTKKELSDMALGVRELSKRLGMDLNCPCLVVLRCVLSGWMGGANC